MFVRPVRAVLFSVAYPAIPHAKSAGPLLPPVNTAEVIGRARLQVAVLFVRAVGAVALAVALVYFTDAKTPVGKTRDGAALAHKLRRGAAIVTASFVTAVTAMVDAIAAKSARDTASAVGLRVAVGATEADVVATAGWIGAALPFVTLVQAIMPAITALRRRVAALASIVVQESGAASDFAGRAMYLAFFVAAV